MTRNTHREEDLAHTIRPTAAALANAVDKEDKHTIRRILRDLDTQQLYALAVVLAAHVDVPLTDHPTRRADDVDHVYIRRILARDYTRAGDTTRAEREFVVAAWEQLGRPLAELGRGTGWNIGRYRPRRRKGVA